MANWSAHWSGQWITWFAQTITRITTACWPLIASFHPPSQWKRQLFFFFFSKSARYANDEASKSATFQHFVSAVTDLHGQSFCTPLQLNGFHLFRRSINISGDLRHWRFFFSRASHCRPSACCFRRENGSQFVRSWSPAPLLFSCFFFF